MMRRSLAAVCAMVVCSCLVLSAVPGAAAELDISVGDYWTYVYSLDAEGMILDGDMKMKVTEKDSFAGDEVFVIEISGSGEMSGEIEDLLDLGGEFTLSGTEMRLTSNYSFAWSILVFSITAETPFLTMTIQMGIEATANPVQDDYIGDDPLEGGTEVISNSTISTEQWFNALLTNESYSDEVSVTTLMTVADATQTVVVPAGSFECWKITMEVRTYYGAMLYDSAYSTLYYSEKVNNYVKMEGDAVYGGMFSSLELKSYSADAGAASFLSDYWWVLVLVVVVIVVVVLLLIVVKRGGRTPTPVPGQQPGYQYQAPPPVTPPPQGPPG